MKVRWITDRLGTAAAPQVIGRPELHVVDVRDMVDKGGNRVGIVRAKIDSGLDALVRGEVVVVACDYGISRSNAVASGILALHERLPLSEAVRRVQAATGETEIKLEPLAAVQEALGEVVPSLKTSAPTVLVTGGSGMVGSALLRLSRPGQHFTAPIRRVLDLESGATALGVMCMETGPRAIVHLANPRVYTSNIAFGQALTMLRNVIEVCVVHALPLVYVSSWEVYSGLNGDLEADESTPLFPKGPYGESKRLAESMIQHHRRVSGLQCALLRSATVYGPGAPRPKFLQTFRDAAKNGREIITHRFNNGDPALDLMHVDDLARAISLALDAGHSGDVNLGTGVSTTTLEIARHLIASLESESQLRTVDIDASTSRVRMNSKRAENLLGWKPVIGLKEGLQSLWVQPESVQ